MQIGNSAITEVTMSWGTFALQYLDFRFRFLECIFFIFMTEKTSGRTKINFEMNVKKKAYGKDLFSFGFEKKPLKKYQVSKCFFKKQVYINWFI